MGDFGNVVKDPFGNVQGAFFDNIASLVGDLSILRRGLVVSYVYSSRFRPCCRRKAATNTYIGVPYFVTSSYQIGGRDGARYIKR